MNKTEPSLLQKTYIQKSRLFLLPLTGLARNKYFPSTNTYISSPDLISSEYSSGIDYEDEILIIAYSKIYKIKQDNIYNQVNANFKNIGIEETGWDRYETVIMSNKRFIGFHESEDEFLYTFDLSDWHDDWKHFIDGRYTLMSEKAKKIIKGYKWESLQPIEQRKLHCYLYSNKDENCFKDFAEELGLSVEDLKKIKELCNPPNLKLETYILSQKKELNETKSQKT